MKNCKLPRRISQDFKEGPVALAIIEAVHKNIGSEDTLAVDKARNVAIQILSFSPGKLLTTVRGGRPQMSLWSKATSL